MEKRPESFQDLLNLRQLLDETIDKPRENGFKQRYRTDEDIKISIIAEVVEFNEETKFSHKTWKQKEFNEEKLKEEAVDILFFFLEFINKNTRNETILDLNFFIRQWDILFNDKYRVVYSDGLELAIIKNVSCDDIWRAFTHLIDLYRAYSISQEEIYSLYYKKWKKDMERPKKDWTLRGDNNVAN